MRAYGEGRRRIWSTRTIDQRRPWSSLTSSRVFFYPNHYFCPFVTLFAFLWPQWKREFEFLFQKCVCLIFLFFLNDINIYILYPKFIPCLKLGHKFFFFFFLLKFQIYEITSIWSLCLYYFCYAWQNRNKTLNH